VLAFTHGGVLDIAYRAATVPYAGCAARFCLANAALNWLDCATMAAGA
jgi:hypothetical protein